MLILRGTVPRLILVRLNNDGRQQPLLTSTPLDINGISSKDPAKINERRYRLLILLIFRYSSHREDGGGRLRNLRIRGYL